MPLATDVKQRIMTEYATVERDTGSPEVQVAMLVAADQRPDRAPQAAQARPPQPPRPAAARRPPSSAAQLPRQDRHHPLPLADRAARPASLARHRGRWPTGAAPRCRMADPPGRALASVLGGGLRVRRSVYARTRCPRATSTEHRPPPRWPGQRGGRPVDGSNEDNHDMITIRGGHHQPGRHAHHPLRDRPARPAGRRRRRRLPRRRDHVAVGHHRSASARRTTSTSSP